MQFVHVLFGLALLAAFTAFPAKALNSFANCDPRAYGAKGDGVSKDTAAIQAAIDACEGRGGGTVRLIAGRYLSAPIVLKSKITLQLDKGATLLGSADHGDYPSKTEFRVPGLQSLVSATDASHVAITGEGVIDGAGESWWEMARSVKNAGVMGSDHPRPRLVVFDHCKHVRVEGVTIQNSPMWQLVLYYSDDVMIRDIKVLAPAGSPNTDAIDPFSSSNVRIDHVFADVGDDDIAIKSGAIGSAGPDEPSREITITDCTFVHGHGLSVGSEIAGGARNIRAERIHFEGTDNGIRVKANRDRGNDVGPLTFREIDMKGVKNALIISEYYPKILPPDGEAAQPVTRLTPRFHDITLENVTATGSISAGAIAGLPEAPIRGVVLRNVKISAQHGLTIGYAEVSGEGVEVNASESEPILNLAGAKFSNRATVLSAAPDAATHAKEQPWPERAAKAAMERWPEGRIAPSGARWVWNYELGTLLEGVDAVWENTADPRYYNYIKSAVDQFVTPDGAIPTWKAEENQLDNILLGRQLLLLYDMTQDARYAKAATLLYEQLVHQPRTASGGFWHKQRYPNQMWLDGLYMAEPFYAEYAGSFHHPEAFEDITHQFLLMDEHARDAKTGLLYHGWDESKQERWADKQTGLSSQFWARGMGWYMMALVDTLPYYPEEDAGRKQLIEQLNRDAAAVTHYQDVATGLWYQVLDKGGEKGNYLESSASCMFIYALAKGARQGYLPRSYLANAERGYKGVLSHFIETGPGDSVSLTGTVKVGGLGGDPYRDGSYAYYIGEKTATNDPKGVGAFLLASEEMENAANANPGRSTTMQRSTGIPER